jgi:CheY-like chemotaxis protein
MKPLALVVENDSGTRRLLHVLLGRIGFEVDVVPTGSDALLLLEQVDYSALVLDLLLPGVTGRDVLAWIGRTRPDQLSRTIVISSAPPSVLAQLRADWPQIRTLRKPFELGSVVASVQAVADGHRQPELGLREQFTRASIRAGAKSGVVATTDGSSAILAASFGYPPTMVESFFPLRLDAPMPISMAMSRAHPVWIASTKAAEEWAALATIFSKNETRAVAAIPLVSGGRIVGGAGWSFREPRMFGEGEQEIFLTIAERVTEWLVDATSTTSGA